MTHRKRKPMAEARPSRQWSGLVGLLLACLGRAALGAEPGTELWRFPTGAGILSSAAVGPDGTVYVGSYDEKFYAIRPNGTLRWNIDLASIRLDESTYIFATPALSEDGGTVYFGTEHLLAYGQMAEGELYAVNTSTGASRWVRPFTGRPWAALYSDPAVGPDGTIYVGCYDSNLYAINPNNTLLWRYLAGNQIYSDAIVAPDGSVYFGCDDGKLYALDAGGKKQWAFQGGQGITGSPVLGPDGTIYFGATWGAGGRRLYAVNPEGTKKWEYNVGAYIESSPALAADGTLYFGANDGNLYALSPLGIRKWVFPTGGPVRSSPAVATDGTVCFGSDDGKVYAVDSLGRLRWSFQTGNQVYASPAIAPDGTIYVGSKDGNLYALQGDAPLADTYWPVFRHDLRRTGRSTNTVERLMVESITYSAGSVTLRWSALPGRTYVVQTTAQLPSATWDNASSLIQAAGTEATWSGVANPAQRRFYRVQRLP